MYQAGGERFMHGQIRIRMFPDGKFQYCVNTNRSDCRTLMLSDDKYRRIPKPSRD